MSSRRDAVSGRLAEANAVKLGDALSALLDPMDPDAGYTHAPPLDMTQRNFCSAVVMIDVLSAGPRPHASERVAQTITVTSTDNRVPRARRHVSRWHLKCRARHLP